MIIHNKIIYYIIIILIWVNNNIIMWIWDKINYRNNKNLVVHIKIYICKEEVHLHNNKIEVNYLIKDL